MTYPVIRKPTGEFFPHGGNRSSEKHWNDTRSRFNRRRFRADPLKDGWDSQEDPVRKDGPDPNKPDIPI